jgi:Ca-activated chloride channel family protein
MRKTLRIYNAVFLFCVLLPMHVLPAQEGYKISVDAAMVTTDVTVIGNAAAELRGEDFVVYDNDVTQPVSFFSRDEIPLAVAIVIDRSLSVQKYMAMLQISAVSTLRRLKPEDQVALFAFDYSVSKINDLTEDRALIAEKIGKIKNQLGTNIYDAIYEAAKYLKKKAPQRRRAIIFISDNIQMGPSGHGAKGARGELLETATALYNIKTPADFGPGMYWQANRKSLLETDPEVKRMAAETGGEVLDMQKGISIQAALEKIISNLRLQYTIGFNPSDPGKAGVFRRLAVKFAAADRCPGCQLLTRSGYYPGVSAPLPPASSAPKAAESAQQKPESSLVERNIVIAGSTNLDMTDIPFTVKTAEQPDPGGQPHARLDLQIDFSRIAVRRTEDRYACKVRITVFYADSKGKILGSDWRILEGQLKEETYQQAVKSGVAFATTIPLKVPQQILRIVVYDEGSDKVGSKTVRLP